MMSPIIELDVSGSSSGDNTFAHEIQQSSSEDTNSKQRIGSALSGFWNIMTGTQNKERLPLLANKQFPRAKCIQILAWIGLIVACLEKLVSGSVFAISIYVNDLKTMFNYSQTEVEVIISMVNIGQGLTVFPGMFFDRFGPQFSNLVAIVLTTTSFFLIWSATKAVQFYSTKLALVAFYFFLAGFGSMFAFVASQNTSIVNLDSRWRGKIIGIQDALYGGSPVLFSQIYYQLFDFKGRSDEFGTSQYDFRGFSLLLAITFCTTDILCLIFSHYYKIDTSIYEKLWDENTIKNDTNSLSIELSHSDRPKDSSSDPRLGHSSQNVDDMTFWQILKNTQYNIFLWTFVFMGSVDYVAMNNLTSSSRSLGFSEHDALLVPLLGLSTFCSSITTGIIADYFPTKRLYFQLSATVFGSIAMVIYISGGHIFGLFIFASVLVGLPSGIMWVSVPTEISERFGTKHFGRNWGFMRAVQTIVNFAIQYLFGYFYELNIPDGSIYCYGIECIRYGYVFLLAITFLSFLVFLRRSIQFVRNKA